MLKILNVSLAIAKEISTGKTPQWVILKPVNQLNIREVTCPSIPKQFCFFGSSTDLTLISKASLALCNNMKTEMTTENSYSHANHLFLRVCPMMLYRLLTVNDWSQLSWLKHEAKLFFSKYIISRQQDYVFVKSQTLFNWS